MKPCWNLNLLCHFGIIFAILRVSLGQSCTFQSGLCDWISAGSGPRWRSSRDPNTSSSSAEELVSYAYVTITQDNGTALLQSPEVTAATTDTIEISFQYQLSDHSQGDLANALSVQWSRNGGDFDNTWHTSGPTDAWVTTSLLLAQGGVSRFAVQFMAEITVPSQDALVRVQNAEIKIRHDSCASSPCLHGGLCFGNGRTFTCICTGGYRGERCQILPGVPLSRLFRGRTSDRGATTLNPRNVAINITSMTTVKGNPRKPETSTDIPTSYGPTSLTSGQSTVFQTRGPAESSTAMATTNPTSPRSATDSSLSPCMRRSPAPAVTAATTEASGVTDDFTNIGTPISDTSTASVSRLTTQSEHEQSTTQTPSTLPQSTEATLSPFPSSIPELTSSDSATLTTTTPSVNDPTTAFEELSPVATDVVPGISSTNEPSATRTFTSISTKVPPSTISTIEDDYSTMPDASTTSLESTEAVQTTQRTILISFGTEMTTIENSESSKTAQFVTESLTTKEEVGTNTETASPSTNIVTTAATESSTEESTTGSEKYTYSLSTESQTSRANDLVTQSFTTKEELSVYTDFTSTATDGVVTTETITTAGVSTEERTTDIQTPGYSIGTGAPDLRTVLRTTSATTDTSETPTTLQTVSNTESTKYKTSSTDATESTETSIKPTMNASTEGSITDIPTTGIGVESTSSSSSSSSSSPSSFSSTATLETTSNISHSTEATKFFTNISKTTDNTPTSSTDVNASSQSSLNSTSASVSGSENNVNVPLAVGLSVTGVVGVVAAGAAIFIVRRARRVSYGLTQ